MLSAAEVAMLRVCQGLAWCSNWPYWLAGAVVGVGIGVEWEVNKRVRTTQSAMATGDMEREAGRGVCETFVDSEVVSM